MNSNFMIWKNLFPISNSLMMVHNLRRHVKVHAFEVLQNGGVCVTVRDRTKFE